MSELASPLLEWLTGRPAGLRAPPTSSDPCTAGASQLLRAAASPLLSLLSDLALEVSSSETPTFCRLHPDSPIAYAALRVERALLARARLLQHSDQLCNHPWHHKGFCPHVSDMQHLVQRASERGWNHRGSGQGTTTKAEVRRCQAFEWDSCACRPPSGRHRRGPPWPSPPRRAYFWRAREPRDDLDIPSQTERGHLRS